MNNPTAGSARDLLLRQFQVRWLEVGGEYISISPGGDLGSVIAGFLIDNGIKSVVLDGSSVIEVVAQALKERVGVLADFGRQIIEPEKVTSLTATAEAGITSVDALIADTGTLVVASRNRGDRFVSTLPPIHLAVISDAPIFPDLAAFMGSIQPELSYTFITGPSRTADIEKLLVRGVHGPVRVAVFGPPV